jgi:hypothetical protein
MFPGIGFVTGHEFKKIDKPGGTGVAEQGAVSSAEKKEEES